MTDRPAILARLRGVRKAGDGWTAFCPAHNDTHKRSLSVGLGAEGRTLLHCHAQACSVEAIVSAARMEMRDLAPAGTNGHRPAPRERIVATYDYTDGAGTLLYQVVRYAPKDFRQRRPDGHGGWTWTLGDVRRVLYRLPDLAEQRQVTWLEGEKECDRLAALGIVTTTAAGGANAFRDEYADQLQRLGVEEVVIIPDHDGPGHAYARAVARACRAHGIRVRRVTLPGLGPLRDKHGEDSSDWLDAGHTPEELHTVIEHAEDFPASEPAPEPARGAAPPAEPLVPFGVGAGTFLAQTFPPSEAFVEGILSSDGTGWIGGEEKAGKSYYAVEEALCLALGLPVCGRFEVPQSRRVLFVEEEDPPRRLHARLRALLRGHAIDPDDVATRDCLDRQLLVSVWEGVSLDDAAMLARLDATIATFTPAVCYLDVLRKLTVKDLNKANEAGELLRALDELRRRHGVLFRVLHHYRKQQGFRTGRGSQEIGGSYVLGAWGECSLFFEPVGRTQGAVRVAVQVKDGPPVPGFRLKFESEGPAHAPTLVRLIAEEDAERPDADEVVLQAVATLPKTDAVTGAPGVSRAAIATALKRSEATVRRSLKRLEDAGRVLVTGYATKKAALYGANEQ